MSRIDERLEVLGIDTSEMTTEEKFTAATGLTHYDEETASNDWYVPGGAANVVKETEQGPQGAQGQQGPQGAQGAQGQQGAQGAQGQQGPQGEQGNQGEQGAQGQQGPQGEQGEQGNQGPQGEQGNQGEQGAQGAQGNPDPETYTITFMNGDEVVKTVTGETGTDVSAPEVEKEGYEFNGWSVDGENPILPVDAIVDSDMTYVALWIKSEENSEPNNDNVNPSEIEVETEP